MRHSKITKRLLKIGENKDIGSLDQEIRKFLNFHRDYLKLRDEKRIILFSLMVNLKDHHKNIAPFFPISKLHK
jgi:hypothetical protein